MTDLPHWQTDADDRKKAMKDWVFAQLDQHYSLAPMSAAIVARLVDEHRSLRQTRPEIEALDHNDIGPLREVVQQALIDKYGADYLDIRQLIHLPNRGRGKKQPVMGPFSGRSSDDPFTAYGFAFDAVKDAKLAMAVEAPKIIRALWQQHYGKKNRPKGDKLSAEALAAEYWGVTQDALVNASKKLPAK